MQSGRLMLSPQSKTSGTEPILAASGESAPTVAPSSRNRSEYNPCSIGSSGVSPASKKSISPAAAPFTSSRCPTFSSSQPSQTSSPMAGRHPSSSSRACSRSNRARASGCGCSLALARSDSKIARWSACCLGRPVSVTVSSVGWVIENVAVAIMKTSV